MEAAKELESCVTNELKMKDKKMHGLKRVTMKIKAVRKLVMKEKAQG